MVDGSAPKPRPLLTAGLAALPSLVLMAMNSIEWRTKEFETIVLIYRLAIYVGLAIALVAIFLAVRQFRRGGSYKAFVISILIAVAFIAWVGPDAYLDVADVISSALGDG
jgi:hypothetical protein